MLDDKGYPDAPLALRCFGAAGLRQVQGAKIALQHNLGLGGANEIMKELISRSVLA